MHALAGLKRLGRCSLNQIEWDLAALRDQQVVDVFGVVGFVDFVAERRVVHDARDRSEGFDMFACARGWACEKDDEFDGLGVHGLELHRGGRATDREGRGGDAVALAVRDCEPVTDSCGASLLA